MAAAAAHPPKNGKAGRLGNDRPSLGARLGVGYRSLGVCGKGASMSGLGGRRRAMSISLVSGALGVGSAANFVKSLSDMNYNYVGPSLMEAT